VLDANDTAHGVSAYTLYRIAFTGGVPVAGTRAVVAAADPGSARGMFLLSH
jgi:hypothetical protein